MKQLLRAVACALTLGLGLVVAGSGTTAQAATTTQYREGTLATAVANFALSPSYLRGVNDWDCVPSPEHPEPVVLQHATFVNFGSNFVKLAPRLLNEGYCVYAQNYGMTWSSFGRVGGLGSVTTSVRSLAAFVERVRTATGSEKVDVVGHSQGGLVAYAYIKTAGGAATVDDYVAWGGSQNGTTLNGIATLGRSLNLLGFAEAFAGLLQAPGVTDQAIGSRFMDGFRADPAVPAGPDYTTIQTRYDTVVTPYETQSIPGANNVVLQDLCADNRVGHVGLFLDEPTLQLTVNALAGGPDDFRPTCTGYGPAL
ncbi:alpha/beta fold hydrolase [Nocardioides zeae]|uniref:Alpha/beta fold hydrolase n=1 Tax=Nocardioides imazamoxiresistens TaxID=3231893 RepID=A0ABU3PUU3_9ACTN|nr:alpha/beta fold hydrolase [Nocardioides zeae]MDT9592988.1 alpha/beta fold hydrolase [Nocardioides zeae]